MRFVDDPMAMQKWRMMMMDETREQLSAHRSLRNSETKSRSDNINDRQAISRELLQVLQSARISECKLVPWGSNYTFAVALERPGDASLLGIYKPTSGEIPLWDFESGSLYLREYASYLLSRVLGWHFIPPTVLRDGPHGDGTVQLYIEPAQDTQQWFAHEPYQQALKRMFVFDLLTNNADRKSSHFFVGRHDRRLWGIDHGLTFHVHPKLRTVIWDFAGDPLDRQLKDDLARLVRHSTVIGDLLAPYLRDEEIEMLFTRAAQMCNRDALPKLHPRRNVPFGW